MEECGCTKNVTPKRFLWRLGSAAVGSVQGSEAGGAACDPSPHAPVDAEVDRAPCPANDLSLSRIFTWHNSSPSSHSCLVLSSAVLPALLNTPCSAWWARYDALPK